jgi:hypothetical protein
MLLIASATDTYALYGQNSEAFNVREGGTYSSDFHLLGQIKLAYFPPHKAHF